MKILLATTSVTHRGGGITSYNEELINLFKEDNEIHLLTEADESNYPGFASTICVYGHSIEDISFMKDLSVTINEKKFDLIINSSSIFITLLAPYLNSHILAVSHFVNGRYALNAGFNGDYTSAIVALSEFGKDYIIDTFSIADRDKVRVIYNFVADKEIDFSHKINHRPLRIVYPGGTSTQKSVDVIQRLLYRLSASKLEFEFIWIGNTQLPSSNISLFGLHTTPQLFSKDDRIHILGKVPREKAEELMASANIFLLPSRGEGCPMTLLEAMRGGCIPIVSDAKHGSLEIIRDSKAGLIVRQDSSKDLYTTIRQIIEKPKEFEPYYKQSMNYLNDRLSQNIWRNEMSKLFSDIEKQNKKVIPFSEPDYITRKTSYLKHQNANRRNEILLSAKCRFSFEIAYLANKLGIFK